MYAIRSYYEISDIRLVGGPDSDFRLNINGISADELQDLEIPANDSIYVFVEVTINPLGENQPIIVKDSIEFLTNTNLQYVKLVAWGQDIELIKSSISVDAEWTDHRPYVVYENVLVEKNATLKINPGVRVFFHAGTGLYVKGKMQVDGNAEKPVVFQADRLEAVSYNFV